MRFAKGRQCKETGRVCLSRRCRQRGAGQAGSAGESRWNSVDALTQEGRQGRDSRGGVCGSGGANECWREEGIQSNKSSCD